LETIQSHSNLPDNDKYHNQYFFFLKKRKRKKDTHKNLPRGRGEGKFLFFRGSVKGYYNERRIEGVAEFLCGSKAKGDNWVPLWTALF
jgi:hypothetical protein